MTTCALEAETHAADTGDHASAATAEDLAGPSGDAYATIGAAAFTGHHDPARGAHNPGADPDRHDPGPDPDHHRPEAPDPEPDRGHPHGPDHGHAHGPDRLVLLAPGAVAPPAAVGPAYGALVPLSRAEPVRRTGFSVAADGSYGACLADAGAGAWYPERWTLGGPEPYTVPLPGNQPEDVDAQVLPLPDGRVLIRRGSAGRHDLALLYPTGPGTGEVPVGFLHGEEVRLLPPPATGSAYAVGYADGTSTVWLVHGGQGLERLAEVEGRCTGGVWLDRAGRTLALDREVGGRVKTVVVDLGTGAVGPLLQITEESDDRLLMADPDSGLLLVRSDAPGTERLGWGVLGSDRPVRFPVCLRDVPGPDGGRVEPVAVRAGEPGAPESCAVLLRIGTRSALWRPTARRLASPPTPPGWLVGSAWWAGQGTLRLPFACADEPYGVRDIAAEQFLPPVHLMSADAPPRVFAAGPDAAPHEELTARHLGSGVDPTTGAGAVGPGPATGWETSATMPERDEPPFMRGPLGRVVPLQQAPLAVNA